ncbi:putative ABC transport system permease protein [Lactobacillus apis]|uniref:ABC transporter permease n=1 Tax=Lactobacillus apis TaxID=303541 RepID=UPI000815C8BF|nr:ABC transporter permease [Lactobacillus apis]SCB95700.1 putative ABC transport system permease protein [Lactobacillus apis]
MLNTFWELLLSASSQGLLWSLMAIGVYLTFRILDLADMTAEGSFPLGGAIATMCLVKGVNPFIATLAAFGGGLIAGLVTGFLNTKLRIPSLLAGIITMTGLYSITSRVMQNAANVSLLGKETIFSIAQKWGLSRNNAVIVMGLIIALLVIALLVIFFRTEIGLAMRATGDNPQMSAANGIKTEQMKILGYMISNGCIALSGALLAQNNGFADLNSGVGTLVIGLASIIIAEVLVRNLPIWGRLLTLVLGAIIYRLILALVFQMNVEPADAKLASALVLVVCLVLPNFHLPRNLKGGKNHARSTKD